MTNLVYDKLQVGPSDELGYFVAIEVLLNGLDSKDLKKIRNYIDEILGENNNNNYKALPSDDFLVDDTPPF